MRPRLTRKLLLEAPARCPDGGGGMTVTWESLGTVWAEVRAGTGSEAGGTLLPLAARLCRITVRAAAEGALCRPRTGQRFADGERRYRIIAVAETPGMAGLYLTCDCRDEVAP